MVKLYQIMGLFFLVGSYHSNLAKIDPVALTELEKRWKKRFDKEEVELCKKYGIKPEDLGLIRQQVPKLPQNLSVPTIEGAVCSGELIPSSKAESDKIKPLLAKILSERAINDLVVLKCVNGTTKNSTSATTEKIGQSIVSSDLRSVVILSERCFKEQPLFDNEIMHEAVHVIYRDHLIVTYLISKSVSAEDYLALCEKRADSLATIKASDPIKRAWAIWRSPSPAPYAYRNSPEWVELIKELSECQLPD